MNHSFNAEEAKQYGIPAAVLLVNFRFWIAKNRANEKHFRNGRTWTYNSVKAFAELFPYMGNKQIRAALAKLVKEGVLMKHDFSDTADRTLWYAFVDEEAQIGAAGHLPKKANGLPKRGKPLASKGKCSIYTDVNTDINADSRTRGTRLPQDWYLTKSWAEEARRLHPTWTDDHIRFEGEKFRDHWIAVSGQKGLKTDWLATWRNWCRNAGPMPAAGKASGGAWWTNEDSKLAKAIEVGVGPAAPGESAAAWEGRIRAAIDNGGKLPEPARPVEAITVRDPGAEEGKRSISPENRAALLAAKQALKRSSGVLPAV